MWRLPILLGLGLPFALGACSPATSRFQTAWGCQPVEVVKTLSGRDAPAYVVLGEFTETNEAPAAFAEIACHMALDGKPLFVGVSEYLGGATDAETRMRTRLDRLVAQGAQLTVAVVSEQGREVTRRSRSVSEKRWAQDIMARVSASGAARALLLVTRAEASCARARAQGERFAGFDPMPLHLPEGEVLCLEATSAGSGGTGATVRLYEAPLAGFHGEVALASLTRPALEMASSNQPEAVSNQAEAVQWKQESCDGMTAEECRARTTGDPDEEAAPGSSSGWPIDPEVQAELDEFLLNLPVPALPVFNREENGQTIRPDQPFP